MKYFNIMHIPRIKIYSDYKARHRIHLKDIQFKAEQTFKSEDSPTSGKPSDFSAWTLSSLK